MSGRVLIPGERQYTPGAWRSLRAAGLGLVVIALAGCGGTPAATSPAPVMAPPATAFVRATATNGEPAVQVTVAPTPTAASSATVLAAQVPVTATSSATATAAATSTATAAPRATQTAAVTPSKALLSVNGRGIAYSYPEGWELTQQTKDGFSQVSLEEPGGALLSLTIYGTDMEPRQLSAALRETMTKQFAGVTATPLTGTVGAFAAEGYALTFSYMGVPMSGSILSFRSGELAYTLYTQAADADLGQVQPGFDLVKTTFAVK